MFFIIFLFLQLLICAVLLFTFVKFSQFKSRRSAVPFLALFIAVVLLFSDLFIPKLAICHDIVTVTAVKNEVIDPDKYEVSVSGFKWGNYKTGIPKTVSGKWSYTNENKYTYTPQSDDSHPSGLTDTISLSVPSGRNRALMFAKSKSGGKISVLCCGKTSVSDTRNVSFTELENSSLIKTLINFCFQLLITAVTAASALYVAVIYLKIFLNSDSKGRQKCIYAVIAAAFFLWNVIYLPRQEFWLDEMFQIGFSGTGKSLLQTLMVTETTPPLFRLIANIWYNIMPYGEEYLLLLPTLFGAGFVFVTGLLGYELGGKNMGCVSCLLAAVSPALLHSGVDEFRSNSLLALLSAIGLYMYIKKQENAESSAGFTVSMILLSYTHYFGVFLCGAFFLLDAASSVFEKKSPLTYIKPYIVTFISYIPWLIRFLSLGQIGFAASWMTKPSLNAIYSLLLYLSGSREMLFLLAIGMVAAAMGNWQTQNKYNKAVPVIFIPCIMIACLYVYGTFIRPEATLWTNRYFLNILPCIICLCAYAITYAGKLFGAAFRMFCPKALPLLKKAMFTVLVLILVINHIPVISAEYNASKNQDFKATADAIYAKPDIYGESTAAVILCQDYVKDGWNDYYLTMQGKRSEINCISKTDIPTDKAEAEKFFSKYKLIYLCYLQGEKCPSFDVQISEHYTLTNDDKEHLIRTYVRNGEGAN